MRRCECVYTYTGPVTDRQFVLQWAPPLRERLKLTGAFPSEIATLRGHRWEASLIEGLAGGRACGVAGGGGRESQMISTIPPAGFILDYDEEPKNCTGTARGFWLFLFCYLSLSPPASPSPQPSLYRLSFFAWSAEAFGNEMGFFYGNCTGVSLGSGSFFGEHLELIKLQ